MALELKSSQFRGERERAWLDLDTLVAQVEKQGLASLSASDLERLPILYRSALSALSVARSVSLDRNLTEYLESLTGRAYFAVYSVKRSVRDSLAHFLVAFPRAVRRIRWAVALSAALMIAGVLVGFLVTRAEPERFYAFVGEDYAGGRGPHASTDALRAVLYNERGTAEQLTSFATFLLTHNAKIGMLCFALGFAAGVPVIYLLVTNGLIVGAFAALYASRGLSLELWAWLLPHGITELGAVMLCGGAGFALATALIFPGRHTRLGNLALAGRSAAVVVLGAVVMFFIAGLIEGIFRQTVHSVPVRWAVATASLAAWLSYFTLVGRERRP